MRVGKRLECVLERIETGLDCVVDIGADHGILTLKILETKHPKLVVATDISAESLSKTQKLVENKNLKNKVRLVVSDGFQKLHKLTADCVIIAGLGGREIVKILSEMKDDIKVEKFIFQPMQDTIKLREFLFNSGFEISFDQTIKDRTKFYSVIEAKKQNNKKKFKQEDLLIGVTDRENLGEEFIEFISLEVKRISEKSYLTELDKLKAYHYTELLKQKRK